MAPAHETPDDGIPGIHEYADMIDGDTFEQILEMDEDEDERDFSKGIVYGFFDQAEATFQNMDNALDKEDFEHLSQLGHFLKGSSATLGLTKIKDACEKIQHCKEDLPAEEADRDKAIGRIRKTLDEVKSDYVEVARILKRFFGEPEESDDKDAPESPESD